jgi:hypothetical protein
MIIGNDHWANAMINAAMVNAVANSHWPMVN